MRQISARTTGSDARCRRSAARPCAHSSDNNTGKHGENSPRGLRRRRSGRVLSLWNISDVELVRGETIFESPEYPRRPSPAGWWRWCGVCGGLAICWMLVSHYAALCLILGPELRNQPPPSLPLSVSLSLSLSSQSPPMSARRTPTPPAQGQSVIVVLDRVVFTCLIFKI